MRRNIFHTTRFVLFATWTIFLSSCVYDDIPAGQADDLEISFSIAIEKDSPVSRGTIDNGTTEADDSWGDDYPTIVGSEFDSRIDMNSFRLALYKVSDNGNLSFFTSISAKNLFWLAVNHVGSRDVYHMKAYMQTDLTTEEVRSGTYRVMVWVNTPDEITAETLAQPAGLDALAFDNMGVADRENVLKYCDDLPAETPAPTDISLSKFTKIPMWGCATVSLAGITPGESFDLKPLNVPDGDSAILLLRSMAKASVEPDESLAADSRFSINSLTLIHSNRKGFVMPYDWQTLSDTRQLKFKSTVRELTDGKNTYWNVSSTVNTGGAHTIYLPEFNNDNNRIRLRIGYTYNGTEKTADIFFCRYDSDGKPIVPYDVQGDAAASNKDNIYDIVRNFHYKYEVGLDEATAEIFVNSIRIEDWVYGGGGLLDPVDE